jgi:hypothetical protein
VGFVVDKVAMGQVFSEYFGFPWQSSFHRLLHNHHRSSGTGTIGQQWPTYQVDSVSPHSEKLKKKLFYMKLRFYYIKMFSCKNDDELHKTYYILLYLDKVTGPSDLRIEKELQTANQLRLKALLTYLSKCSIREETNRTEC